MNSCEIINKEDILTSAQVAAEYSCFFSSQSQVAKLAKMGKLNHWRMGKHALRFLRADVDAYIAARRVAIESTDESTKFKSKLAISE